MANAKYRGPRVLGEILSDLYALRGFAQLQASGELERAWNDAVGETAQAATQVGRVRRGVLEVTVADSALLEELVAFRKSHLLAALQKQLPDAAIADIRFRIGQVRRGEGTEGSQEVRNKSTSG
jgi:predicted nucleic acid-binding Zn ribbon protein